MFREAKNKHVSKNSLVKGLTIALEKKLKRASKDLLVHIKTFTGEREEHYERIQALIRARFLRNGRKSSDQEEAESINPETFKEKKAVEYVIGPVGIQN